MTKFYLNPMHLEMWMKQNKAIVLDCFEGCLLDNLLIETKRGYAAIYERYLNPWSSDYCVVFQTAAAAGELIDDWYEAYAAHLEAV